MSYYCEIHFKQIEAENVFDFLKEFKRCAIEKIPETAKDVAYNSPLAEEIIFGGDEIVLDELKNKTIAWGRDSVFSYRYFYNKELKLLGIYGVDPQLTDIFDDVIAFQNSTDQDYSFDTWDKIEPFHRIADKWKNMSDDDIKAVYMKDHTDTEEFDADYYRRSYAYAQIWSLIHSTFDNDDEAIYFKLFSKMDLSHMMLFYAAVKQAVEAIIGMSIDDWKTKQSKKKGF